MEKKVINSPFVSNGDLYPGQTGFDKYYIDFEIKDVVKKTGEGDDDYIIVHKIIEHKKDIVETIQASAGEVGVENMIQRLARSGMELEPVVVGEDIIDTTQMPTNLAEAIALGEKAKATFNSLPSELVNGRSYEDFINNVSTEDLVNYFTKKINGEKVEPVATEVNNNGD